MSEIVTATAEDVRPTRDVVFEHQGIPPGAEIHGEIETLWTTALDLFAKVARPAGTFAEISVDDFSVVYRGDGWNEPATPVGDIYRQADDLALFAGTLGDSVSREIKDRFAAKDLAVAGMLDSVASAAADNLADVVARRFFQVLSDQGRVNADTAVLGYSPGYCGWHITGQEKLFESLHPEGIGISLNDSSLMQPLKSVSGVLIAGPKEIHDFPNSYPFCSFCETRSCRARIRGLFAD